LKCANLFQLGKLLSSESDTVDLCQDLELLPRSVKCPTCKCNIDKLYCILRSTRVKAQYRFQCNKSKCKRKGKNHVPIRKNTWFAGSNISLRKSLILIYCFINKFSYKIAVQESSISSASDESDIEQKPLKKRRIETSTETISDYYNYCREVCSLNIENCINKKIGGKDKIVEIDKAKFGKRKYNRGRIVDGTWVLGGICRETREIFLKTVEKRDKKTLLPIIQEYVEPGSIIITDCWASYKDLGKLGYTHMNVNHSENFVDPDTGACTNLIENRWWCIKRELPSSHCRQKNFALHLVEYMWRVKHGNDN